MSDGEGGGTESRAGRVEIARLADDVLPALVARLEASALGELEVRDAGWRVRLRKLRESPTGGGSDARHRTGGDRRAAAAGGPSADGGSTGPFVPPAGRAADRDADDSAAGARYVVTSPAVGYYTPRDGVGPGHSVAAGDVLGHVDVLGVRHDVHVAADGIIARVLVQPGEAVEYGQELFRIERRATPRTDAEPGPRPDERGGWEDAASTARPTGGSSGNGTGGRSDVPLTSEGTGSGA